MGIRQIRLSIVTLVAFYAFFMAFQGPPQLVYAQVSADTSPQETEEQQSAPDGVSAIRAEKFFTENRFALDSLSEEGQGILQHVADELLVAKADFAKRTAGLSIVMTITTQCYDEPEMSTRCAETINEYLEQLLAEDDKNDISVKITYLGATSPEDRPVSSDSGSHSESEFPPPNRLYEISAELKIKERGPRVSHPTDTILYEIVEGDNEAK